MAKDLPIQFKGTALKIIQAQLRTADVALLHAALAELTGNSPDFFENDLAVLDFSNAESLPESADWPAIRQLLRASGLHAAATLGLPEGLAAAAEQAGLPTISASALSRRDDPRAGDIRKSVRQKGFTISRRGLYYPGYLYAAPRITSR